MANPSQFIPIGQGVRKLTEAEHNKIKKKAMVEKVKKQIINNRRK
jgi:hypothetical protein